MMNQDRDQIKAHRELQPRVVEGVEAAFDRTTNFSVIGDLGAMMVADGEGDAQRAGDARKITIGRYCNR